MENPVILVSTDGSELSEKAIVTAAKLAKNHQYLVFWA